MTNDGNDMRGSSVIRHVMKVLRSFAADEPTKGVTDIAEEVGLHKSSVSRILAALEQEQVVEQDQQTRKYRLGLGLIAVAGPLLANLDVRQMAVEEMVGLRDHVGETVALSVWDGQGAVTVEQVPSREPIKHTSSLGSRYATTADSTVQVFLAHVAEDVATDIELGSLGVNPRVDIDEFHARLKAVRTAGVAVNRGDTSTDEVGICAPVFDHRGEVAAALLIASPAYRIDDETLERAAAACSDAARRISARLGHDGVRGK